MQVAEVKTNSSASPNVRAKRQPFFSKEGQGSFFSKSNEPITSFFSQATIQPKLTIGRPNDKYEVEADAMADKVVQRLDMGHSERSLGKTLRHSTSNSAIQPKCEACEGEEESIQMKSDGAFAEASSDLQSNLTLSKGRGNPLSAEMQIKMGSAFGTNLSAVRIHTGGTAVHMSKELNAQAFTHGNDIYFNQGKYDTNSTSGKHLLAHELTHTVQQGNHSDESAHQKVIQRTSAGDVLDTFFSPFSEERLWVMDANDPYTQIVREWQPVIDTLASMKNHLENNCPLWSTNHLTDNSWAPGMTDPPVTDPNAFPNWIHSPSGTDPVTCALAFSIFQGSRASQVAPILPFPLPLPQIPTIQTTALHTCSIGSFGLYVTLDNIDCNSGSASLKIWMYNAMDEDSFGPFVSIFPVSGMERQYMWWNWIEDYTWSPGSGGGVP